MSHLLKRASLREHGRHRGQTLLLVFGIAVGTALVLGLDLAIQSAETAFRSSASVLNGRATWSLQGGPQGISDRTYRELRNQSGFSALAPVIECEVSLGNDRLTLVGIDPFAERGIRQFTRVVEGDFDAFLNEPRTAMLSRRRSKAMALDLGDTFIIERGSSASSFTLVAFIESGPEHPNEVVDDVVVVDIATAQEEFGTLGFIDRIDLGPNVDRERMAQELPLGVEILNRGERSRSLDRMARAFRLNLDFLAILALIVAVLLVQGAMVIGILRRRRWLGLLRARGVAAGDLIRQLVQEGLLIGLIASSLGLALGYGLAHFIAEAVTTSISDHFFVARVRNIDLDFAIVAKAFALGTLTSLIAALGASLEVMRIPLLRGTRHHDDKSEGRFPRVRLTTLVLSVVAAIILAAWPTRDLRPVYGAVLCLVVASIASIPWILKLAEFAVERLAAPILGPLAKMASRSPTRHRRRIGLAIASLSLALAMSLGVGSMISSFRTTLTIWLDDVVHGDVYVGLRGQGPARENEPRIERAIVDRLEAMDESSAVATTTRLRIGSDRGRLRVFAFEFAARRSNFPMMGDKDAAWRAYDAGDVLASEPLARRLDLSMGDVVTLKSDRGPLPLRVGGIFRDYSSDEGYLMMSRQKLNESWSIPDVSGAAVFCEKGVSVEELSRRIETEFEGSTGLTLTTGRRLIDGSVAIFDRTFAVTQALRVLALIVAFLGILGALGALALERRREMAILRARGFTRREMTLLILIETVVAGLAAGLIAVVLGVAFAYLLTSQINPRAFGWSLPFSIDLRLVFETLALSLIAALVAGFVPAWQMAKAPVASSLRSE